MSLTWHPIRAKNQATAWRFTVSLAKTHMHLQGAKVKNTRLIC
jgi:hypothetical protein